LCFNSPVLTAYLVCLAAGMVVLGFSAFAGHDGHGSDVDGDVVHSHADHTSPHGGTARLPFFSLRFWIWAITFFGLTGLVLTLGGTPSTFVPVLAVLMGLGTGWGASYVLGRLSHEAVGTLPEASSLIGREGRLLLPLRPGGRSKVRLSIGGVDTDLLAETDGRTDLPAESQVLVVGIRGLAALVEPSPAIVASDDSDKEIT